MESAGLFGRTVQRGRCGVWPVGRVVQLFARTQFVRPMARRHARAREISGSRADGCDVMTQSRREQKAAPPGRGSHVPGADETKLRSPLFFFLPRFVRGRLCTPLNGSTVVLMTDCMSSERASETNVLSCGLWLAIPCTTPILILALFATYNTAILKTNFVKCYA